MPEARVSRSTAATSPARPLRGGRSDAATLRPTAPRRQPVVGRGGLCDEHLTQLQQAQAEAACPTGSARSPARWHSCGAG